MNAPEDTLALARARAQAPAVVQSVVPFVSIVMPCLNEAESITACVFKARLWLSRSRISGEVIVVDNGSEDDSVNLAEAAGARVVHEARRGYGAALLRGFAEARGDWIIMGDADDTYDWTNLDPLIEPLQAGHDLVVGDRFGGGIEPGAMTWSHRYIGTPALSWLLKRLTGTDVRDSQCGLRAFRRETLDALRLTTTGMELASEMLLKAARSGLRVASVPVPYGVRKGEAKLNTLRDGWRHLRFLLLASPNYLFTVPGAFLALLGILVLTLALTLPGQTLAIGDLSWQPVFAGTIFLVVGMNALLIGFASQLHATTRGLAREGAAMRFYHRHLGLEAFLLAGLGLGSVGIGLDVILALEGGSAPSRLHLAAFAQAFIITGANLGFVGALCGLLEDGDRR
jgi:glycosyltransferase involved in cell wall biosynthesis